MWSDKLKTFKSLLFGRLAKEDLSRGKKADYIWWFPGEMDEWGRAWLGWCSSWPLNFSMPWCPFAQANPQTFKVSIPCMLLPYLGPLWRREQVPAPSSVVGFAKGYFPTSELTIPISMSNVILCFTILFHRRFMHLEPFLVTFIALTSLCIHTFDLVLGRAFFCCC